MALTNGGRSNYSGGPGGLKRVANVKVRVFEERYSGGVLDMNIFCLYILADGEKTVSGNMQSSGIGTSTA